MNPHDERRRFQRIDFDAPTELRINRRLIARVKTIQTQRQQAASEK